MQPELEDVEGLLFVSFTSKEALEVHVGEQPANGTPAASPISPKTPMRWREEENMAVGETPETDEEKVALSEAVLLQDLGVLKHRQVIHPVLQEVGMKLSSLDPMKGIDLQYLGVRLPLPPPKLPEKSKALDLSPGDEGLSFTSRTGKTSDVTQIKGWRNKFTRKTETSPPLSDGSQKNLSAFCSNMLDEYLESEAQYMNDRADAFSTRAEDSVAYQLPVKSSSYVKTLDSVLKNRKAASKSPSPANRPCPLSHKPLLYSALAAPAPPLAGPRAATPVQAAPRSTTPPASSKLQPVAQRLAAFLPVPGPRPATSGGQSYQSTQRAGLNKSQVRLTEMELGALNQGLSRTQLTTDRLSVALAGLLTKQMLASQVWKVTKCPTYKSKGPECGQEFCTLGCVCSSLQHLNRAPFHCRRPDCMFGCTCFKRKITKQLGAGEREAPVQPVYSMTHIEHRVQPHPGSHANRLWNRSTHQVDPEPLFTPTCAPSGLPKLQPIKVTKRNTGAFQSPPPIREEDKDPVYKYLESLMTCARVREFNSQPPPELAMEPNILDVVSALNTRAKPQKTTPDVAPKTSPIPLPVKKEVRPCERTTSGEKEAKKQIEIQSACQWVKDRKMVLEALCQRMNQNRLSRRFGIGPYRVRPIAKIFMRKPSGSIVTYRLHISKPSKTSDVDEDESDDTDEEKLADKSIEMEAEAEAVEDEPQSVESDVQIGVTPFLSGVLPAGRLKARTKPVGCQASGLIQVNGKAYNQARLLLGNMGSLHPANRLAAFITGRLIPPGGISLKVSLKSNPANKSSAPDPLHTKPAGPAAPPVITAKKTTHLKPPTQPPVPVFPPEFWAKGTINSLQNFASGQRSSVAAFQKSSASSPVSLTVSQSLKTPSFLGESGTYSFRICPPANAGAAGQKLPGVTLPGGFTLIELPPPGADGADGTPAEDDARPQTEASLNGGESLNTAAAEPSRSDDTGSAQVDSNPDNASEDLSSDSDSDSSDFCAERDGNDEVVDIETVEEVGNKAAIAQMKEAVRTATNASGEPRRDTGSMGSMGSTGSTGSLKKIHYQDTAEYRNHKRRTNHTFLERQRRSEQRTLFDKLQIVLQSDPRAPRLRLLSLAQTEIENLSETSRNLEEKKRRLTCAQSVYVKELSLLSGKSGSLIRDKLKDICEKQKVKEKKAEWNPFFSNLLESTALVQSTILYSKPPPPAKPLLEPDFFRTLLQNKKPQPHAVKNKLASLLESNLKRALGQSGELPPPKSAEAPVPRVVVSAPTPQGGQQFQAVEEAQEKKKNIGSPAPGAAPASQTLTWVAAPARDAAAGPDEASSSSAPPSDTPPQSFSLPLIRSKTGRLILPSSLKPLGHGFYTLMVMEPRKGEEDQVVSTVKPGDVGESSGKQPESSSELDRRLDSGSDRIPEGDKTAQASNSSPTPPGAAAPAVEPPPLFTKAAFMPAAALLQVAESGLRGATGAPTACLSFKPVKDVPVPVPAPAAEPEPSPPVLNRCRGRPRKTPTHPEVNPAAGNDGDKRKASLLDEDEPNKKMKTDATETFSSWGKLKIGKRRPGRPPKSKKKKPAQMWIPKAVQAPSVPRASKEDGSVPNGFKSPHSKPRATRPLTRAALGKDFPSAKRRSWIDVEKELEPEMESESGSSASSDSE
ncbi:MAX gene-associated protein [Liparis tanakae]|uniref:MAX gene-associated protein n=1 Tax=Liparis tanakae TaxID=230148 RepID=A0A4Z2FGY5_9TELE|nr:MAX gene-associated protein [Liparis tanakae]